MTCHARSSLKFPLLMALLATLLFSSVAAAESVTGHARILDGDTIEVGSTKVRLYGIDAPEGAQPCLGANRKAYPCGEAATERLQRLTDRKAVSCKGDEHDRYGRLLAVCSVDGTEINRALVHEGLAWAFVKYSRAYVDVEQEARQAKRGVFAAQNTPPWEFRAQRWGEAEKQYLAQKGCIVKGNVSRKGERIYHMPWQRDYARTKIDESAKERWFCDEGEAEAAGWRRATH